MTSKMCALACSIYGRHSARVLRSSLTNTSPLCQRPEQYAHPGMRVRRGIRFAPSSLTSIMGSSPVKARRSTQCAPREHAVPHRSRIRHLPTRTIPSKARSRVGGQSQCAAAHAMCHKRWGSACAGTENDSSRWKPLASFKTSRGAAGHLTPRRHQAALACQDLCGVAIASRGLSPV